MKFSVRGFFQFFVLLLVIGGLYYLSTRNYLLFHSLAESAAIVIAFFIFVIAWNTRRFLENQYLLFLGLIYPFVGIFDFLHTLAYKGMGVFPDSTGANLATQLWIQARYIESVSFLLAPLFLFRKVRVAPVLFAYSALSALLLLSIYPFGIFPDCYNEGSGLTPFKVVSEYAISLALVGGLALVIWNRSFFQLRMLKYISISIVATIASELSFTTYLSVYDPYNMAGHLLKVLSFYFIYRGIVETGLKEPYGTMFMNLKKNQEELLRTEERLIRANEQLKSSNEILQESREKLERSEKHFQDLFHRAPVCFVIIDENGIVTEINTTCETVLGLRARGLIGRGFEELIGESEKEEFRRHLQTAGEKGDSEAFTLTVKGAGGKPLRFVTELIADRDSEESLRSIRLALLDVTELDSLRKESQRLENLWDAFFSASKEGFTITTLEEGRYLEVNEGYLALTGYSREELIGKTVYDVGILVKLKIRADLVKTLRKDDSEMREAQLRRKDGQILDCLVIARRISLSDQELVLGILRDISETKKLERSLEETCQVLEQRNNDLQNFIHTAAHDLRTPLINTIGFFVLLKKAVKKTDPNIQGLIERISDQLYRYDRLLRDLLDFARVGAEEVGRDRVDLAPVVKTVLEDREVLDGGQAKDVRIQENLPRVFMAESRVYQIFENLLSNSFRFRKKDEPLEIEVGVEVQGDNGEARTGYRVFFVRDNGVGIHPQNHSAIFNLFSRTNEGETDEGEGTGVGLAIVKRILETEGGWIRVESAPGKGATFFLSLPVVQAES